MIEEIERISEEKGPFSLFKVNGERWIQEVIDPEELPEVSIVKRIWLRQKSQEAFLPSGHSLHIPGTSSMTALHIFATAHVRCNGNKNVRKMYAALFQMEDDEWGMVMFPAALLDDPPLQRGVPMERAVPFQTAIATA